MLLLKPLISLLFIATVQEMSEAAPQDVHIHLHGLHKQVAVGRSKSGVLGCIQSDNELCLLSADADDDGDVDPPPIHPSGKWC